ncbi:hypothetical protein GQR58_002772 [Nymphon striatum]|nr:hypothetical protein GQR58_002772 [Nymphon striatum]
MDSNLHATQLCVSAGPPDPVENCSIINETRSRVHVECDAGHDGGMPQIFYAEVYLHPQHILQSNISAFNQPIFISSNLKPNTHYMFVIYAANSKDRSQTVAIIANTKAGVSNKSEYFVIKLFNYRYPVEKIGKCPTQYGKEDPRAAAVLNRYVTVTQLTQKLRQSDVTSQTNCSSLHKSEYARVIFVHVSTNKYIHKSIVKKMLGQEDGAPLVNGVLCLSTPKHNGKCSIGTFEKGGFVRSLRTPLATGLQSDRGLIEDAGDDHCLQVKFSCTFLFIPIHTGKFKCRYINIPAPRFCDTSLIFQEEKKKLKYRCVEISEDEIDLSSCEDYCEEIGGWGKCVEPYKFQPLKSVSEDRYTSVSNSPF